MFQLRKMIIIACLVHAIMEVIRSQKCDEKPNGLERQIKDHDHSIQINPFPNMLLDSSI